MRSLLGVIVVCIALVCSFSFYGESNGYCVSVPDGEPTEDEQYFESSDCDEEDTCDEDSTCDEEEEEMIFHEELLNDIRFAEYDDDDWLDNEYIQALRHYLDDIDVSKIKNERIKPYSKLIKGKFINFRIEPTQLGGMLIIFSFIDKPEGIFTTWVYSDVDEATGEVSNYTVKGIIREDIKNDMSREEILKIVQENPEFKLY